MARSSFLAAFFLGSMLLSVVPARAETRRVAVVVGSNAGSREHPALRFAEADAGKVARVLVELGGVAPNDMLLLQGRPIGEVEQAFASATLRSRQWHGVPDTRIVFFFYFSGHSDGKVLELGTDRLDFPTLRRWIADLGADVRLVIVDSCRSGSLLASKGGSRAEPFDVTMRDDLTNSGEAVITSSAANEIALESSEIRGSFFTHHLVSGLRGAADVSGDGQVTLAEAYEYAFTHTASATANTLAGVQHPSYDYRLSGQGELVMTELVARSGLLILPAGYQRILVTQLLRDQVVAELNTSTSVRLALAPGAYGVRAWRQDKEFVARLDVPEHGEREVRSDDWVEMRASASTGKGSEEAEVDSANDRATPFLLGAAAGRTTGIGQGLGGMTGVRLTGSFSGPSGFVLNASGAWGDSPAFSELRGTLSFGYRVGRTWGRLSAYVGAEAGAGVVRQRLATGDVATSPVVAPSTSLGADWWLESRVAIHLEATLVGGVYQRDSSPAFSLWPGGYLGVLAAP